MRKPKLKKIDPELKAKWIEALLSGEYKQGRGVLRSYSWSGTEDIPSGTYCCLGVLGKICGVPDTLLNRDTYLRNYHIEGIEKTLPRNGFVGPQDRLSYMNYNGRSFKYIAAYIQRYL